MPVQSDGWTKETDIQTLFFRLTIDSACEFLFGESVDSQLAEAGMGTHGEKSRELVFSQHFDSANMHLAKRFRFGDNYWWHNPKEFKEDNKIVHDFMNHYVDLALKRNASQEKKAEEGHGKKKYVFLEELARQTQDPVELRSQLLNILLAGRDSTASLLSWLFHQLLRNPDVFEKLRKTVVEDFGSYEDPKEITFATLKGCQYLQNTLNEVLRLWTIVPGNARRSNKPTTLPRGGGPDGESPIYLKSETEVNYSIVSTLYLFHTQPPSNLNAACHAPPQRPLGSRRRRIQARALPKSARRMGVLAFQRWTTYLYRAAICAH